MKLLKRISLGAVFLFHFVVVGSVPALAPALKLVEPLFSTAWSKLNPNSMQNLVKQISKDVKEIKTHLQKIEVAIIFGQDVKTIEFLIDSYIGVINKGESAQGRWANTAMEFGGDGFQKTLSSLKEMMDGSSNLFAKESIFEVIVNK